MKSLDSRILEQLWYDLDSREANLRDIVTERMGESPPVAIDDQVVATYFLAQRIMRLEAAGKEISYHATSGAKDVPPGSLLEQCTARTVGIDAFDVSGRIGLIHVAFPLKMLLRPDGSLTSTDLLHTVAGPIVFDVFERQDAKLVALQIPEKILRTFPGPAYGPSGLRQMTGFPSGQPAFGAILKPTSGVTPEQVGETVGEAATCALFMFVKEDENLYPNLDYSPVVERTRLAVAAIHRAMPARGGRGLIFAPHVGGPPHEILETVHAVLAAGATGVMFSETYAGGAVRMVREATRNLQHPPAIYGHNAGIGTRTRSIWREVIDLLARLDGIDFRQTAPVRPCTPFLKPYGAALKASEAVLSRPLQGIRPTMIVRAGGLDQGNIAMNLADAEERRLTDSILFMAGSAINSIKNAAGKSDSRLGSEAMLDALDVYRSGELRQVPIEDHVHTLVAVARRRNLKALAQALRQRYPEKPE
jgi:ribulose 1,5-bisphosphate carboxylase large subunit-like protein